MPSPDTIERFIARVESNAHAEAIAEFYLEDGAMRENLGEPRRGRDALVANERRVLARARKVESTCIRPVLVSGDTAIVRWIFRFEWLDGSVTAMEELAYQRWQGERIAEEQFFYDPAQLVPVPKPPGGDEPAEAPSGRAAELAALLLRHVDEVPTEPLRREALYDTVSARLADGTAARKLGASVDTVAPGKRACPYHLHHAQEEMFVVLEGRGAMRVAGELLPVRRGSVVFCPPGPEYPHQMINTSSAPLRYLAISTREMPEICEYPDSGKHQAWSRSGDGAAFRARHRTGDDLDYWDGEP